MRPKSILIVEDDDSIAEFLRFFLEDLDQNVLVARDGQEGLERARSAQPDLILLNLSLPLLDGWELARRLKLDPLTQSIPIIAVSGADRIPGDADGDDRLDGYVSKPFDVSELENTLKLFLG